MSILMLANIFSFFKFQLYICVEICLCNTVYDSAGPGAQKERGQLGNEENQQDFLGLSVLQLQLESIQGFKT